MTQHTTLYTTTETICVLQNVVIPKMSMLKKKNIVRKQVCRCACVEVSAYVIIVYLTSKHIRIPFHIPLLLQTLHHMHQPTI